MLMLPRVRMATYNPVSTSKDGDPLGARLTVCFARLAYGPIRRHWPFVVDNAAVQAAR